MFFLLTDYDDGYGYNYDILCKKSIAGMENICQEQVFELRMLVLDMINLGCHDVSYWFGTSDFMI
jgi:hypothetical protein